MKVHGDNKPEKISAGSQPNKPGRAWVRICLNAKQDEHGWVYDEYVTEVADGSDLQARVNEQNDALLLQAVGEEYGTPLTSVDDLREQRIADSKTDLAAWLSENPLTWTDGKKYAVTSEKQAQLTSALAVQQVALTAGVKRELRWNSTGDECTVWQYNDLCALALAIAAYVEPRVSIQQAAEVDLRNAATAEEALSVAWNYA
ncbi:hypothetical protein [Agathobaculum butyriciproducens]|uniref:hypothetical protein n=1 Tax=Agathobaculum butyriciproducens TaxID=1628085 RepID=UPI001D08D613|nr:hypothetical protein [Agathobaculum butyriciproducens]MCQ5047410.1 hypothetical protein [Agathobaculum butyriciproducens]